MRKVPHLSDLHKILKGHEHQYMKIGTFLNVPCDDLLDSPQLLHYHNLNTVFTRWFSSHRAVTWEAIANLSDHLSEPCLRDKIIEFLSSREAHKEYLDMPDFDSGTVHMNHTIICTNSILYHYREMMLNKPK